MYVPHQIKYITHTHIGGLNSDWPILHRAKCYYCLQYINLELQKNESERRIC